MKKLIPILFLPLANLLLLSCNQDHSPFPANGQGGSISSKLLVDITQLWTPEKGQKFDNNEEVIFGSRFKHASAIGFCFLDYATIDPQYRLENKNLHDYLKWEIAQKLLQEYGDRVKLNLFYLNSCNNVGNNQFLIRIALVTLADYYVSETDFTQDSLGFSVVGPAKEQINDFTFVHFSGANLVVGTQTVERPDEDDDGEGPVTRNLTTATIIHVALHEFGHALGFLHEHERTDAGPLPKQPTKLKPESNSVRYLGSYDPESVMNYYSGEKPWLSTKDVDGIRLVYCKYNPALIINNNLNCPAEENREFSHCVTSQNPAGKTKFVYERAPIGEYNLCQSSNDPNRFHFEVPPGSYTRTICFLGLTEDLKNALTMPVCIQLNRYTNEANIHFNASVKYDLETLIGSIMIFPDDSLLLSQMVRRRENIKYFIDRYPNILGLVYQDNQFSFHPIWSL